MVFFAQGTVQFNQAKGKTSILINPVSDYRVRHKTKDGAVRTYTIFVRDDDQTVASFPVEEIYEIDDSLSAVLREAAFRQTRIQVEIEETTGEQAHSWKIIGVLVPVTAAPL
jgi:molybdopterin synthase catalytic subunit